MGVKCVQRLQCHYSGLRGHVLQYTRVSSPDASLISLYPRHARMLITGLHAIFFKFAREPSNFAP